MADEHGGRYNTGRQAPARAFCDPSGVVFFFLLIYRGHRPLRPQPPANSWEPSGLKGAKTGQQTRTNLDALAFAGLCEVFLFSNPSQRSKGEGPQVAH